MSILSITFHATENQLEKWDYYVENNLQAMVENLMEVDKYILSEVGSDMINEGKNTNLLLIFDREELREQFIINELENIAERIYKEFGEEVMIFQTFLNPKKHRL